jgi:acyl-CoA thioester hydrolase
MISQSRITVRYAETDQMGIAHHANYPIWYEVARTDLIKEMGMTYSEMENRGLIVPLLELQCKYISPAYYEDELTIEAKVKTLTRVKIEFEYCIYKNGNLSPINVGHTLHALVTKDLKPVNVKSLFPDIYQKLEAAVEKHEHL